MTLNGGDRKVACSAPGSSPMPEVRPVLPPGDQLIAIATAE